MTAFKLQSFFFPFSAPEQGKNGLGTPFHDASREVQTMQVTASIVNLTLALPPSHHRNQSHSPVPSLKPFQTGLGSSPIATEKSHYVSNKPFYSLLVCVCHQSQHPYHILGGGVNLTPCRATTRQLAL